MLLLPCTFASGREYEVAAALPGVSRVYRTRELPRLFAFGLPGPTRLLHLGGDLMYSALLVRRWDGLCWAVLFNTDRAADGKVLSGVIDPLVHRAADAVTAWPAGEALGK